MLPTNSDTIRIDSGVLSAMAIKYPKTDLRLYYGIDCEFTDENGCSIEISSGPLELSSPVWTDICGSYLWKEGEIDGYATYDGYWNPFEIQQLTLKARIDLSFQFSLKGTALLEASGEAVRVSLHGVVDFVGLRCQLGSIGVTSMEAAQKGVSAILPDICYGPVQIYDGIDIIALPISPASL